ncbi:MAG: bifunctional UDP-3-O-[3-hydroxymyristoyl] N-acetylglucosamine deacetylase/3-hydroxyacyl-ACP dehydratase [Gemmatimonadetes bacterium]|nr:bifunctional UDP-3-O-[3-hydroxymyristoyl] N-acetylglucosamine deacetylase/3-hydroxyacyl-ACP dehydratase [Gemmatimonadota bacterium]
MIQDRQRTIGAPAEVRGVGLHTGTQSTVRFLPAAPNSGIRFVRTDLPGSPSIPARIDFALDTIQDANDPRRTTLDDGTVKIGTVEHLLSATAGLGLDNLDIEISSAEPCEPDGSARPFVEALQAAGIEEQEDLRHYYETKRPITFQTNGTQRILLPHDGFKVTFTIDYPNKLVGTQYASFDLDTETFVKEICSARTFAMLEDVEPLRAAGLIKGGSLENAVVVTPEGIKSTEPLRFPDEFVRHKILDLVGDMSLLGMPIKGHLICVRGGHSVNVAFVKKLMEEAKKSYRWRSPGQKSIDLDIQQIMEIMPHRYPFLLIDRIVDLVDRERVTGLKNVTVNEPFFQGHFPGHPIMPAVLIVEAMAQAGGVLLLNTVEHPESKLMYFMGIDNAKFRRPVRPGDTLRFEVRMDKLRGGGRYCRMHAEAFVGDDLVAEADLMSAVVDREAGT